jgi:hypothetical protein
LAGCRQIDYEPGKQFVDQALPADAQRPAAFSPVQPRLLS